VVFTLEERIRRLGSQRFLEDAAKRIVRNPVVGKASSAIAGLKQDLTDK